MFILAFDQHIIFFLHQKSFKTKLGGCYVRKDVQGSVESELLRFMNDIIFKFLIRTNEFNICKYQVSPSADNEADRRRRNSVVSTSGMR